MREPGLNLHNVTGMLSKLKLISVCNFNNGKVLLSVLVNHDPKVRIPNSIMGLFHLSQLQLRTCIDFD